MISITSLNKEFHGVPVLRDVSLSVKKGETVVLLGPSGSGKTTLLRCLAGLAPFSGGAIEVDGIILQHGMRNSPHRIAICEIRKRCGFVFQQYHLFPHLTALENLTLAPINVLRLPAIKAQERGRELLENMGLASKAGHRPFQLSGGEQQRIAVARALAMSPAYMLYDEPTSALDGTRSREIWSLMAALADKGQTQIIVTHQEQIQDAIPCRVLRMADGAIVPEKLG